MTTYTIIDPAGAAHSIIDVPDDKHLALNTPAGMTAVLGRPPSVGATWNATTQQWEPQP